MNGPLGKNLLLKSVPTIGSENFEIIISRNRRPSYKNWFRRYESLKMRFVKELLGHKKLFKTSKCTGT